ncbi:50S ribosomal protein L3 [Methanosarcinales archaeon]|nr:MAG: 50S ribosomal protein L3 [Methanosarcinales archaeon]
MPTIHRPRRGSLAYSPRKRAKSEVPQIKAWPESDEVKLLGFAGYKAGMGHVVMLDSKPNSPTEGMEVSVSATVVEVPEMRVAAIRGYANGTHGKRVVGESWAREQDKELSKSFRVPDEGNGKQLEDLEKLVESGVISELRAVLHTRAHKITGIPKKKPDLMETGIGGGEPMASFEFAKSILGTTVRIGDLFKAGDIIDVVAVTTGKGTQGPVKRWGISLMKNKHSRAGSKRQVGNLGPWSPAHVSWRVPQLGQTGYQQRTDFNKMILKIGDGGEENITPSNGFINYGVVRNEYVLIKGSVPGPVKRLIRMRHAMRPKGEPVEPQILNISLKSTQGVG